MNILVACEFSGVVRDAFTKEGHNAFSCDFLSSESEGKHLPGDCLRFIQEPVPNNGKRWDIIIAHPPCTYLAVSGIHWNNGDIERQRETIKAICFFKAVVMACQLNARIGYCVENPVCVMSSKYMKPSQIIQPWMFGHPENKKTCLWLSGLPLLKPSRDVRCLMKNKPEREVNRVHHASPGKDRWKERSRTLPGIAKAMAKQWGEL